MHAARSASGRAAAAVSAAVGPSCSARALSAGMDGARLPVQPPEAEDEEYEKDEDEGLVPAVPENGRNAPY